MKLATAAVLCSLLTAGVAQDPPEAKRPPVIASLRPAFSQLPEIAWRTFVLELENTTTGDFDLTASLGYETTGGRALHRVKLASHARKRLFFYLPADGYRLTFDVLDGGGRTIANGKLEETNSIGRWSGRGSGNMQFALMLMDRPPPIATPDVHYFTCPPESCPDRWIGFDGLDAIFLRDYPLDRLMPAQRAALLEWVRRGGRLILYAGSNREWLTTPAVQALAPVALGSSKQTSGLAEIEKRFGAFRETTPFLYHWFKNGTALGEGETPHGALFRNGAGSVTVLPFDLERAPFDSWPFAGEFRKSLMGAGRRAETAAHLGARFDAVREATIADINTLPPFLLLFALALLFILAVGPVNYFVLRRLKLTLYIVLTIPAVSALFLVVVIASGYILRGTSTVAREIVILETRSGEDFANESHFLSLFSPSARTYDIAFNGTEVGVAPRENSDDDREVTYDQSEGWTLREVPFTQWQARLFLGQGVRSLNGAISFRLEDGALRINNLTPFAIRKGVYVVDGAVPEYLPFEEVPPSSERLFRKEAGLRPPKYGDSGLEGRFLAALFQESWQRRAQTGRYLVCLLDRTPDEISISGVKTSDRLCVLQVHE